MAFFPGALSQQTITSYTSAISTQGALGFYDSNLLSTNYANQFLIIPYNDIDNQSFKVTVDNYLNISRSNLIEYFEESIDQNNEPISVLSGTTNNSYSFSTNDFGLNFSYLKVNKGNQIDLQGFSKTLDDSQNKLASLIIDERNFNINFNQSYIDGIDLEETNFDSYSINLNDESLILNHKGKLIKLSSGSIEISGSIYLSGSLKDNAGQSFIKSGNTNSIIITTNQNGSINLDSKITSINGYSSGSISLVTDDISEDGSPTNLWFTDSRARSAVVLNNMSGSQTDQSPSISTIKNYISGVQNSISSSTSDIQNEINSIETSIGVMIDSNGEFVPPDPSRYYISGATSITNAIELLDTSLYNLQTNVTGNYATLDGIETLTNKTLISPIVSGNVIIESTASNQSVLKLKANSLVDGTGILNIEGSEPDIVFNQTGPGFTTFTIRREDVDKIGFGKNDSDNFYITRNDGITGWVNDSFVLNRQTGNVFISSLSTASNNALEGALTLNGGVGIGKNLVVGTSAYISGNLSFSNGGSITIPPNTSLPSSTTATTQNISDDSTKIATTAFVKDSLENLSSSLQLSLGNDQVLFVENGVNITGSTSFTYKNVDGLSTKTLVIGTEPNFPLTVKTAITTNDSYNGTYTALLAQNTSTSSMASTNIYLKNDIANEIEGYAVFGLEGSNYNSNSNYLSEKANSLYIGNSHGDITLMPNFYQDPAGGSTHITYDYGLKGISVTNAGAISTETTFNPLTQEYVFNVGNPTDILVSRGDSTSVTWVSQASILSASNALITNITSSVGLQSNGTLTSLTGSNYLTSITSVKSGLIELDSQIKSINDDINLIESNRLISNSYYVNDGVNDIQTIIDNLAGNNGAHAIYMSAGSYSGSLLTISNAPSGMLINGPFNASSTHKCEFISRGLTLSGNSTTRVVMCNLEIEGVVTINGTLGRHYFKNVIFGSTVTINNSCANFVTFEDCNFAGGITISSNVTATVYFNRCGFANNLVTSQRSGTGSPLLTILTECTGLNSSQTNLTSNVVLVGRTGYNNQTVYQFQNADTYVYDLANGLSTTFNGSYSQLRNLPTLVTSSTGLSDSSSLLRTSDKGANGGVAPLDNAGKIDISYLPSTVLTDVHAVADSTERLNIPDLVEGDVAVQADDGSVWIWDGTQWLSVSVGNGTITSVNSKTGPTVTLTTDDIAEPVLSPTNLWFTNSRAKSAAVVNTVSGSETDQAPSVSSIKTYITNSLSNYVLSADYTDSAVLTKIKNVDGSGSGLDADLLDGLNSTDFVRVSTTQTISGNKTFTGSTFLSGSATTQTQTQGDNSTAIATTAYVDLAVANVAVPNETIQDVAANLFVSSSTTHNGIKYTYDDNNDVISSEVIKSVVEVSSSVGIQSSPAGNFYIYTNTVNEDIKQFLIGSSGFGSEVYFQNKSNVADIQIIGKLDVPFTQSNMQYIYWNGSRIGPTFSFTISAGDHNIYRFVHGGTVTSSPDGITTWYHTLWYASVEQTGPIINESSLVKLSTSQTITGDKTFTGVVSLGSSATATTPSSNDNSTKIATTAFVTNAITNAAVSTEQVQDIVGDMIISGSHSGVTWNYNDASGSLNLSVNLASTGLTDSSSLVRTGSLGQANGVATLDSNGKLNSTQLPSLSISEVYVVQTIIQRDNLTVQTGDIAVVTDTSQTFIYDGNGPTWVEISASGAVTSVNSQTGDVVLNTDNISEGTSNLYFNDTRARTAAVVNSVSGSETNQAPSVSSIKTYVSGNVTTINNRLDQLDATDASLNTRLVKLEYRDGGVWDQDANSIYFDPDNYIIRQTYGAWSFKPSTPNDLLFTEPKGGPGDRHWAYNGTGDVIFTGLV